MSFKYKELEQFRDNLLALQDEASQIMEELVVGEGVYAVKQAKSIAKNEGLVDTGAYRNHFHAGNKAMAHSNNNDHDGSKPQRNGKTYRIDVYNNIDYAKHLEYGHRVVVVKDGKKIDTGKYVKGRFVLLRAIRRTKITQEARLKRKFEQKIKAYIERGL